MDQSPFVRRESSRYAHKALSSTLEKSIQLLDDTSSPSTVLRLKTPSISSHLKTKFDSPTPQFSSKDGLISRALFTPKFGDDSSTLLDNSQLDELTSMLQVYEDEDIGIQIADSLFQNFLDVFKRFPSSIEIFELLQNYEQLCTENILLLNRLVKKMPPSQDRGSRTKKILEFLKMERNTWRLLRSLYHDRLQNDGIDEDLKLMDTVGVKTSDLKIVENLYDRSSHIRQCQLVVDWLEQNSSDDCQEKYFDKMEFFSDSAVAWENTLHYLQHEKDCGTLERPIVKEMDPDAPTRENCPLHDLDREDEIRMLRYMFAHLRSGHLDKAQNLAERYGHSWLAAALEGWRLHHDPNYEKTLHDGISLDGVDGNQYRDVWKAVCWKLLEEPTLPMHEKAMYAALSGNLKALLPVCNSWDDYLWAYVRTLVDCEIESELRGLTQQEHRLEELPPNYTDKMLSLDQVFLEIQGSPNDKIVEQCKYPLHIIQKYIILDDINALVEEMFSWIKPDGRPTYHLVRLMAHIVLFFRAIGYSTKDELCTGILELYVQDLIVEKHSLVAAYTTTLPPERQIYWYSKFLEGIHNEADQKHFLALAEEAGLDVALITKTVVENITNSKFNKSSELKLEIMNDITEEDKENIEAINWLIFDPSQRAEAVRQSNVLMRNFILFKKLDCARAVFNKLPGNSVDLIIKHFKKMTGTTDLPPDYDKAIREYLCFQVYLNAHDNFTSWFNHFHNTKPAPPTSPNKDSDFSQCVAYEYQQAQYAEDLQRWEKSLQLHTKGAMDAIYNVLLFVDDGWMVDNRTDGNLDENRQREMAALRKMCIPQMCYLLHSVLHSSCLYKEALQLADIIASEKNKLYLEFGHQDLRDFLSKLRESSIVLLDQKLDPLGYPIS